MRPVLLAAALALAVPAAAQTLLIGNKGEDTISFVDLKSGRELRRLPTANQPHEIAISPDGKRAAVVAYGGNTIDLIDVATMTRIERIDLGTNRRPHGLVWLADNRLIATTEGSDTLTIVLANAPAGKDRVHAIPTGQKGSHMVAVAAGATAYVANMGSGSFSVVDLDGQAPVRNVPAGTEPEGIALSPDGKRIWIADRKGELVRVFDAANLGELASMPTGKMPIRIAITPDGARAYVSNAMSGTLSVYDARALKPAGTITVSGEPAAMQVTILLSRDGRRLYAAETGANVIAEVDLAKGKVLRRLPAGKNGDGLAISPVTVKAK